MDAKLKAIYYDPTHPAGFGSVAKLSAASGVSLKNVKTWLQGQATYTLHKAARVRYGSRKYRTSGMDHQWQADLVDMQSYTHENDGYKYILTVIDMFSRYAWAEPLKSKAASHVKEAFERIFRLGRKPMKCQSDQGLEFESGTMKAFFQSHGIEQFSVKSQFKAAMVERFNRTLKTRMWKYFTHFNTHRWVDVLPKLLDSYNNSIHRAIAQAPATVTKDNEMALWMRTEPMAVHARHSLKIGDHVRLSKVKHVFGKGYLPNWTEKVFTVSALLNTDPPQVEVQDYKGEEVEGSFYMQEVQKVDKPDLYRIERVIKHRKRKGKKEYLVKWLGYPEQFNSWVSQERIENV